MTARPEDGIAARKYREKEEFVAGHAGTTAGEILLLCLVIPVGLRLYYKLHPHLAARRRRRGGGRGGGGDAKEDRMMAREGVVVEFLSLMAPMLVVQTSLLPRLIGPAALSAGMLALASLIPSPAIASDRSATSPPKSENRPRPLPFLSVHRSCVYVMTTIAILAVDFPVFPRRFCKTEVSGYGWMDLGAASFVIIAGWASALSSSGSGSTTALGLARKAFKKCAPLLLLGFVRLATNKGLEYQEHVSEYGVHWNFFFTLCCVEGSMVAWKGSKRRLGRLTTKLPLDSILALSMMVPYQLFLSRGGGQEFVEDGARRCDERHSEFLPAWLVSDLPSLCDALVANREGILGVAGYLSLRLLAEDVARLCLSPARGTSTEGSDGGGASIERRLLATSAASWAAHACLTVGFGTPNSRRSTNAPFVLWALAHNATLLCAIRRVAAGAPASEDGGERAPRTLEAVNRFGLAVFLSSNVLTGLANLTVDTLRSSNAKAMLVLTVYLASVCGIALLLDCFFGKKKVD